MTIAATAWLSRPALLVLTTLSSFGLGATNAWAADKAIRVSIIESMTSGEFNTEITAGAQAAVKDLGFPVDIRVLGPSSFDPSKQVTIFQNEARTSPDVIILHNVASQLFVEPVLDVERRGIRVVWINSGPTQDFNNDLLVTSDPVVQGGLVARLVADALQKKLGKPGNQIDGKVLTGICVPGLPILENRLRGTGAELSRLMPHLTVVPPVETKPDRDRNYAAWNQMIRKDPTALAYLDSCEAGVEDIVKIVEDSKLPAVSAGYDSPEEIRDAVRRGVIPGTVPANFFSQAYLAVLLAGQAIHDDRPVPRGWLKVTPPVIDAASIQAYIEAWTDPKPGLRRFVNAGLIPGQRGGVKPGQWIGHADMERAPIGALSMSA